MIIGKIDFNEKLKTLKAASFAKFWKDGKFHDKTGVDAEEAHRLLKGQPKEKKASK